MPGQTKTTDTTIAYGYQTYFSKDLLERLIPTLVYAGFSMKNDLPANAGAKSIRMMRFTEPSTSDIQTLTEGTVPAASTHRQLTLEYIDATLAQYGQTITITDVLSNTGLFNMIEQANIQNSEDAALHCDRLCMFELTKNSGTVGTMNYANVGRVFANQQANYAAIWNTGTKAATRILTASDILDAATLLKVRKAPRINGSYVYIVPPQVTRDIMQGANSNTTWSDAAKYSAVTQLFNGEVGKLYGVRVVETTEAYRSGATDPGANPAAQFSTSAIVFTTHMLGRNAFGTPNLSKLGGPMSPQVLLVQGADKSDPLNQIKAMVSWKTYWAAQVTQPFWISQIVTQSGSNA